MRYLLAIFLFYSLVSCKDKANIIDEKLYTYSSDHGGVKKDTLVPNHYFFRHDAINTIGFMYSLMPSQDQLAKKLIMEYKGRVRTNYVHSSAYIRIILFHDNEPIHWSQVVLKERIRDLNEWNNVSGYFVLPPYTKDRLFNRITIFSEVTESKEEHFDIDSMMITIKSMER